MEHPIGIDFGGTGIKGAPVDLARGDFAQDRVRIDTPKPADPQSVADGLPADRRHASPPPRPRSA